MFKKDFSSSVFGFSREARISLIKSAFIDIFDQQYCVKTTAFKVLFSCVLLFSKNIQADQVHANSEHLEVVEVTGSRLASLLTANSEMLETSERVNSIEELLNSSRMLELNHNAGAGSFNDIYLRGADPNLTLTLFNGVPVNDNSNSRGGAADVTAIDPWFLTSAEIVAGARSAIYGSQAVAGAINLISQPDSSGASLKAGLSSNSGHYAGVKYASDELLIGLSQREPAQTFAGSEQSSVNVLVQWQPEYEQDYLDLLVWHNDTDALSFPDDSGGERYAINRELEQRDIEDLLASLKLSRNFAHSSLSAQVSVRKKDEYTDTPAVASGVRNPQGLPAITSDNALTHHHGRIVFSHFGDEVDWLAGAEYQREKSDVVGVLDFTFFTLPSNFLLERETFALFTELQIQLDTALQLNLSGRYDKVEAVDRFSPNVNLVWQLGKEQQIYFDWGDSFKLPSMYALSNPLVGNPDLVNETAITRELGYQFAHQNFEWGAAVFSNHFSNLVDIEPGPPPKLVNRNKVTAKGIEVWLGYIADSWDINASYRHHDIKRDGTFELLGRSKNRYQLTFNKQFSGSLNQLYASLKLRLQDSVLASSIPTGELRLNGHNDLKLNLDYQFSPTLKTTLSVRNLLQDDIQINPGNIYDDSVWGFSINYKL